MGKEQIAFWFLLYTIVYRALSFMFYFLYTTNERHPYQKQPYSKSLHISDHIYVISFRSGIQKLPKKFISNKRVIICKQIGLKLPTNLAYVAGNLCHSSLMWLLW